MGRGIAISICKWFAAPVLNAFAIFYLLFVPSICLLSSAAKNSITPSQVLRDGQFLVSPNNRFELKFFRLEESQNRYLGISCYPNNTEVSEYARYVWVANREKPITDSTGVFIIQNGGNLAVVDGKDNTVWSSNTLQATNDSIAELLDSGNLVLRDVNSGRIIWQSFDHPSDTLLPGMKIGINLRTGQNWMLRSWKNDTDPSPGSFTLGIDTQGLKQFFIWRRSVPYWRSFFWNGTAFQFNPNDDWSLSFNCSFIGSKDEVYFNCLPNKEDTIYSLIRMTYFGVLLQYKLDAYSVIITLSSGKTDQCRIRGGGCGARSICNSNETPPCKCLPGFKASSPGDWDSGNWYGGCTRRTLPMDSGDGDFLNLKRVKIPQPEGQYLADTEANCATVVVAYAYENASRNDGSGTCYYWDYDDDLKGVEENTEEEGLIVDLKLRLASSELHTRCATYASIVSLNSFSDISDWRDGIEIGWKIPREPVCLSTKDCKAWLNTRCSSDKEEVGRKRCFCNANFKWNGSNMNCTLGVVNTGDSRQLIPSSHKKKSQRSLLVIIIITIVLGTLLLGTFIYYFWKKMKNMKGGSRKGLNAQIHHLRASVQSVDRLLNGPKFRENGNDGIDIPFIDFRSILKATEDFSDFNKLGQGGFGPVYHGKLSEETIAVKRLSKCSGQGLEEFKNEVLLIAKLQHRNLVKLLGYCIEGDEKILIYEYMPNKSLDFFLFDPNRCKMLDWQKRFNIILGITRGLIYLHQDSRLRIIHRDFKTSNILLDEEMNPKISDFGLARIFGEKQTQESTNRVVGTFGYMSPEYAAHGHFSIKSDVFSFGVVLLEIISGKKNSNFYNYERALSLTGHAWQLWKDERGMDFIDPSLHETCDPCKALKCIHVGLLCVQENATDRPTMASSLTLLESETTHLLMPKQPAFYVASAPIINSSSCGPKSFSKNEVTISTMEGR